MLALNRGVLNLFSAKWTFLHLSLLGFGLDAVFVNGFDLFRLDAKIIKGLSLRAVIETGHQCGNINPECYPLVIAPRLPQGMRPIPAPEIEAVHCLTRWLT